MTIFPMSEDKIASEKTWICFNQIGKNQLRKSKTTFGDSDYEMILNTWYSEEEEKEGQNKRSGFGDTGDFRLFVAEILWRQV